MRNITKEELNEILRKHKLWLEGKDGGEIAVLSGVDLQYADLSCADLRRARLRVANLHNENLYEANLRKADLYGANLSGANLRGVNLSYANLYGANLRKADLYGANLSGANLRGVNLCYADLCVADLRGADLSGVNLRGVNLCEADLCGADLRGADLSGVIVNSRTAFFDLQCPEEGSFIGWKKAVCNYSFVIVKLLITEDALRSSATTRKCRASKAKVLDIQDLDGNSLGACSAHSDYDKDFIYKVGEVVEVDNFDPCRWKECSAGIHFFITRQEAVNYAL